ncbi:hypothetical protein SEA_TAPIOCA_10 [Mycobacterium phage Tapioca]|uniref:Uncharacterized protein n=16 Tax=Caudoviricetes TaxID=2731619 RepID=G1FTU8_9CAUD|nr:neck protein [Mycobacterium phage Charlie]YP_009197135.1 neck protein [Mycobacterium phage Carcharodon]YP_009302324.1 neck protein [Mycobacterium phage Xeno]YP_009616863.1 neck protein [Mycobacterium phage Pipsqueaks]YP_010051874.1 neck protein [Mycobacterium phage Philonius]YP_010051946.1 neck protein [Mycobacterium phage Aggie]YP_010052082.1 neck protein [Mycobacterium phage Andies]YP_010052147.1 neck protein [Mycobacterium phage Fulbright]YP_010052283.1 neck protein [Mycobacterium pha
MARYKVVSPCAYTIDGKGVHHKTAGAIVELADDVAKQLGDSVERIGGAAPRGRKHTTDSGDDDE